MCGFIGEESLPVFPGRCVVGDTARDARHSGYGIFGRQGEEVRVGFIADARLEPFAFTFNGEPLSASVFLYRRLCFPPRIHVFDVAIEVIAP